MCDSHPVPKVFISLRLLLLRYESYIPNPTFPFLFIKRKTHPVSFRNERHILFPIYTLPVFQNNSFWVGRVSFFHNGSYLFVYFIDVRICVENPNFTLPISYLSLWIERLHGFTSFSFVYFFVKCFLFFKISYIACTLSFS